jgi:hypothetical protein
MNRGSQLATETTWKNKHAADTAAQESADALAYADQVRVHTNADVMATQSALMVSGLAG